MDASFPDVHGDEAFHSPAISFVLQLPERKLHTGKQVSALLG